ncbi:winged helix-turn-helix transcriptional regulator [Candidatus Woesearchaeota archaeon]|nr:winged helix-turn-helix transcriptional regulator [Candidatus Woesearchaeota archaeon]
MYVNHTMLSLPEAKILDVFLDLKRHYFAELLKVAKLTRPRTLRVLRKLVKQGILEVRTEANVKYYSLKRTSLVYATLGVVEYGRTVLFFVKNKTLSMALEMFKVKYADYSVMLVFGSIVKGYATKASDIDMLLLKENVSQGDIKKVEDVIDLINGRTGLKISPYFMTMDEFKKKNELAKQAIEHHILIEGAESFFKMVLT